MEYLRPKDVMQKMKISRGKLYNLIRDGLFPKPGKFLNNKKMTMWLDSEVENVMIELFKNSDEEQVRKIVEKIESARQAF